MMLDAATGIRPALRPRRSPEHPGSYELTAAAAHVLCRTNYFLATAAAVSSFRAAAPGQRAPPKRRVFVNGHTTHQSMGV